MRTLLLIVIGAIGVIASGCGVPRVVDGVFEHTGKHYPTRFTHPAQVKSDTTVVLMGGGFGFDEHWTTPASYAFEGRIVQVTIDGVDYHDADTIARGLAARGFRVYQWSSIPLEDEQGRANPALGRGIPYPELRALSRAALADARAMEGVDASRIVLVGHSLGAARACQIADEGVIGLVLLAGAYVSPFLDAPSEQINGDELTRQFAAGDLAMPATWQGGPAPVRALTSRPALALFGANDLITIHAPLLEHLAQQGIAPHLQVHVYPGLNHQLARESGDLTGPIEPQVVERIGDWLEAHFGRREEPPAMR